MPDQLTPIQQMSSGIQTPNHIHNGLDAPRIPLNNIGGFPLLTGKPADVLMVNSAGGALVVAPPYYYGIDTSISASHITIAVSPFTTTYVAGMQVQFVAANSITGSVDLAINSIGASVIKKWSSGSLVNLASGDIKAGQLVAVLYDTVNVVWQMISPIANTPAPYTAPVFGTIANYTTNTAGHTDTTVTTTFTPSLIKLYYWIQGHTLGGGTNTYTQSKGLGIFAGTTLTSNIVNWTVTGLTDGAQPNGSLTALQFGILPNDNSSITTGQSGVQGITMTLTILSVSSTNFVIRAQAGTGNPNGNNAQANIYYEAYQ